MPQMKVLKGLDVAGLQREFENRQPGPSETRLPVYLGFYMDRIPANDGTF